MNGVLAIVPSTGRAVQSLDGLRGIAGRVAQAARLNCSVGVIGSQPVNVTSWSALGETVYTLFDPRLAEGSDGVWQTGIETLLGADMPQYVIAPHGGGMTEILAALAVRLNATAISGVMGTASAEGGLVGFDRPIFGGKAMARMVPRKLPVFVSVRSGAPQDCPLDPPSSVQVVEVHLPDVADASSFRLVERTREEEEGPGLEEARIIISGGRGLGGAEGFEHLKRLAKQLHGAVGASRAAVDAGWVPPVMQIGQTGKSVSPDLYVAVGISGASQHLAGIAAARHVLAVNSDETASIFDRADLGIVGNWSEILPLLEAAIAAEQG